MSTLKVSRQTLEVRAEQIFLYSWFISFFFPFYFLHFFGEGETEGREGRKGKGRGGGRGGNRQKRFALRMRGWTSISTISKTSIQFNLLSKSAVYDRQLAPLLCSKPPTFNHSNSSLRQIRLAELPTARRVVSEPRAPRHHPRAHHAQYFSAPKPADKVENLADRTFWFTRTVLTKELEQADAWLCLCRFFQ